MAGSYRSSRTYGYEENLGDATEALEQCIWLIEAIIGHDTAMRLLESSFYPMARGDKEPDVHYRRVKHLYDHSDPIQGWMCEPNCEFYAETQEDPHAT